MPSTSPTDPNQESESEIEPAPTAAPDSHIQPTTALSYWSSTPPTLSGILGGYPQISRTDVAGSRAFLAKLRRGPGGAFARGVSARSKLNGGVVDCGAGIGRVAGGFLGGLVGEKEGNGEGWRGVDVVEPVGQFVDVLKGKRDGVPEEGDLGKERGGGEWGTWLDEIYPVPLESWTPDKTYDLIWNQWCLGHLNDRDLTAYFIRIKRFLTPADPTSSSTSSTSTPPPAPTSFIVVKENLSTDPDGEDIYDPEDSSVTRTDDKFRHIFREAGLRIVRTELQTGFPKGLGLFPVRMYALRPVEEGESQ